jgi:hypothetical protein
VYQHSRPVRGIIFHDGNGIGSAFTQGVIIRHSASLKSSFVVNVQTDFNLSVWAQLKGWIHGWYASRVLVQETRC